MDLKIDIEPGGTWDLVIENGDLATVEDTEYDSSVAGSGPMETRQRVAVAFKTRLGEWLYDTDLGLPYASEFLVKNPNLARISARARAFALTIEGVTAVKAFYPNYDRETRTLTASIDLLTPYGEVNIPIQ